MGEVREQSYCGITKDFATIQILFGAGLRNDIYNIGNQQILVTGT